MKSQNKWIHVWFRFPLVSVFVSFDEFIEQMNSYVKWNHEEMNSLIQRSHLVYEFTEVVCVVDDLIYFPAWWMLVNSVNKRIHMLINYLNSYITLGQTLNEFTVWKNS
jgi:hypothetical protein